MDEARAALAAGADVIVAQGTEAGGHGARRGWSTLAFVPVVVDPATSDWLVANPGAEVTINLEETTLGLPDGTRVKFPLEAFSRYCLLNGVDELGFLLDRRGQIEAYERQRQI